MNRKPGDWDCGACQHLNFSRRDSCQRCGEPRSGDRPEYGGFGGGFGGGRSEYGGFGGGRSEYGGFGGGRSEYGSFGSGRGGSSFGAGGGSSFGASGGSPFGTGGSDVRPGDWYCPCGYHNFASRSTCFKCGAFKDETTAGFDGGDALRSRGYGFGGAGGGASAARAGWKSGDWICTRTGCNEHNFASRMECYRCNAPREAGNHLPRGGAQPCS
ncbi:unnamed protein product [Spirodela intermedia]|uniref:RanBP2-type domain-containing protein n=1 Tax=Spirodela intermedia TaxID=51605 RepID=A0A7I8LKU6_SPIIN|nr:unnamed protein product [Spirodela intermedia]